MQPQINPDPAAQPDPISISSPPNRKVAVITASSTGIGLAIAQSLAATHHVIISSRSSDNVTKAVNTITTKHGQDAASGIVCHVGKRDDLIRLHNFALSKGTVTTLILNAAVSTAYGPLLQTSDQAWDKIFEINLRAAFHTVRLFVPSMPRGSSIVFITSIAAYTALPGLGAYSISKTALLGMCKVLSVELAKQGIRVNAVAPGIIKTRFAEALWKGSDSLGSAAESGQGPLAKLFYVPMRRLGTPDDVGPVVQFLCSDAARYITGEILVVAGGAKSKL